MGIFGVAYCGKWTLSCVFICYFTWTPIWTKAQEKKNWYLSLYQDNLWQPSQTNPHLNKQKKVVEEGAKEHVSEFSHKFSHQSFIPKVNGKSPPCEWVAHKSRAVLGVIRLLFPKPKTHLVRIAKNGEENRLQMCSGFVYTWQMSSSVKEKKEERSDIQLWNFDKLLLQHFVVKEVQVHAGVSV